MVSDNWTNTLYSGLYSQKDFMLSFITAAIFFIIVFALTHCKLFTFLFSKYSIFRHPYRYRGGRHFGEF